MDFAPFDQRHYPTVGPREGYEGWAATYEDTVLDLMDLRLFARLETVAWAGARVADLACGTGRVGAWLKSEGAAHIDGVDLTPGMLARADGKGVYAALHVADVANTPLASGAYDLATMSLADEHIADLGPVYREAARILASGGAFVLVGYHPHFLMRGMPTHFNDADGAPVAIESHVHLMSDHVAAAHAAGFALAEMTEGLIDADWLAEKPKWAVHASHPISFAMVWRRS